MPIYDYVCLACQKRFDVSMTYAEYGTRPVICPDCGSTNTRRRLNRVRVARSEASRADSLAADFADPSALAGLENDPQALGQVMRKMGRDLGEDIPPEYNEVVDRLESGQTPEQIDAALPDLGGDPGGGDEE
jgi:putative FmdB family regulatory protein